MRACVCTYDNMIMFVFYIKKFVYPENVALPIGGDRNDKYLLIEIHYDNPGMETGNGRMHAYIHINNLSTSCIFVYLLYVHITGVIITVSHQLKSTRN